MLRRLGIFGLGIPLIAIIVALAYLYLFGSSDPTFNAATLELARDHTVVQLDDAPPVALVVPSIQFEAVSLLAVLPDDERHIWAATRELAILDALDTDGLALLLAPGVVEATRLAALAAEADSLIPVASLFAIAYAGDAVREFCDDGGPGPDWAGVIVVAVEAVHVLTECGDTALLIIPEQEPPTSVLIEWIQERHSR